MNTKFLLLLIAFLLTATSTASVAGNKIKQTSQMETGTSSETPASEKEHKSTHSLPWVLDWSSDHGTSQHPDDDGKCHRFHFTRLACLKKRRILLVCLTKLALAIIHLSCFFYGFAYLFH